MAQIYSTMACPPAKRKRVVLTIDDKLKIIALLEKGTPHCTVASQYGIGKSTVSDIGKQRDKIRKFKVQTLEMGMKRSTKVIRLGRHEELEEALHKWLRQEQAIGAKVSLLALGEKAEQMAKRLHGQAKHFQPSAGWKHRFCKRHGISLAQVGQTTSEFVQTLQQFIDTESLTAHQIFCCDETGLQYRHLPRTLAPQPNDITSGKDALENRATVSLCFNASGSCKLPILVVGTSHNPTHIADSTPDGLPVTYMSNNEALMTQEIFRRWFDDTFVPHVQTHLLSLGLPPKAVLLFDNAPVHPECSQLVSDSGLITCRSLPLNAAGDVLPVVQGICQSFKGRYKAKLLEHYAVQNQVRLQIGDFLNQIDMRAAGALAAAAWADIGPSMLQQSWSKIIPFTQPACEQEGSQTSALADDTRKQVESILLELTAADPLEEAAEYLTENEVDPGYRILTEEEICASVGEAVIGDILPPPVDDHVPANSPVPCVPHSTAAGMFELLIHWAQQQPEATPASVGSLQELHELALRKSK